MWPGYARRQAVNPSIRSCRQHLILLVGADLVLCIYEQVEQTIPGGRVPTLSQPLRSEVSGWFGFELHRLPVQVQLEWPYPSSRSKAGRTCSCRRRSASPGSNSSKGSSTVADFGPHRCPARGAPPVLQPARVRGISSSQEARAWSPWGSRNDPPKTSISSLPRPDPGRRRGTRDRGQGTGVVSRTRP